VNHLVDYCFNFRLIKLDTHTVKIVLDNTILGAYFLITNNVFPQNAAITYQNKIISIFSALAFQKEGIVCLK